MAQGMYNLPICYVGFSPRQLAKKKIYGVVMILFHLKQHLFFFFAMQSDVWKY